MKIIFHIGRDHTLVDDVNRVYSTKGARDWLKDVERVVPPVAREGETLVYPAGTIDFRVDSDAIHVIASGGDGIIDILQAMFPTFEWELDDCRANPRKGFLARLFNR